MKSIKGIILVVFLVFSPGIASLSSSTDVDLFYKKILAEGKAYYEVGNFREAEVNFRIAEFGLLDENDIIKEIQIYYALTLFQLGRIDEAGELVGKMAGEFDLEKLNASALPPAIKNPAKAMLTALSLPRRTGEDDQRKHIFNSELLFLSTIEQLETSAFAAVETNIKKLEQLNKNEQRISYLKGILAFKQQDYKACVKDLLAFEKHYSTSSADTYLLDKLYYHLSLSYYYLRDTNRTAVYYNKVKNIDIKSDLYRKLTKNRKNK